MSADIYDKLWKQLKKDKKSFIGEIKNKRKNGELYDVIASISPILDKNNEVKYFVALERDITKEKAVDRAKSEFVSLASHQLRTPLSTVNWYAEMLLDGDAGKLNATQKDYLEEIEKGNKRMIELVNAL
jgi:signal transduction histidine kinase